MWALPLLLTSHIANWKPREKRLNELLIVMEAENGADHAVPVCQPINPTNSATLNTAHNLISNDSSRILDPVDFSFLLFHWLLPVSFATPVLSNIHTGLTILGRIVNAYRKPYPVHRYPYLWNYQPHSSDYQIATHGKPTSAKAPGCWQWFCILPQTAWGVPYLCGAMRTQSQQQCVCHQSRDRPSFSGTRNGWFLFVSSIYGE